MKTQEFRCINTVKTKNQRDVKCLAYLGTVVHKKKVVISCRRCKQDYMIVGDNLEIKKITNNDIKFDLKVEVV